MQKSIFGSTSAIPWLFLLKYRPRFHHQGFQKKTVLFQATMQILRQGARSFVFVLTRIWLVRDLPFSVPMAHCLVRNTLSAIGTTMWIAHKALLSTRRTSSWARESKAMSIWWPWSGTCKISSWHDLLHRINPQPVRVDPLHLSSVAMEELLEVQILAPICSPMPEDRPLDRDSEIHRPQPQISMHHPIVKLIIRFTSQILENCQQNPDLDLIFPSPTLSIRILTSNNPVYQQPTRDTISTVVGIFLNKRTNMNSNRYIFHSFRTFKSQLPAFPWKVQCCLFGIREPYWFGRPGFWWNRKIFRICSPVKPNLPAASSWKYLHPSSSSTNCSNWKYGKYSSISHLPQQFGKFLGGFSFSDIWLIPQVLYRLKTWPTLDCFLKTISRISRNILWKTGTWVVKRTLLELTIYPR